MKDKKSGLVSIQCFADPFKQEQDYTKTSKQLLDGKLRKITNDDLNQYWLPLNVKKGKIEVAIQGGLGALDFTVMENRLLHAVQTLFSRVDYPDTITASRWQLYEAMGLESITKDGRKYYSEGPYGKERKKTHDTLIGLSMKSYLFVFSEITGHDKKGKPLRRLYLTYQPIIQIVSVYEDVKKLEFKGVETDPGRKERPIKKRFSHYKIRFNRNAIGEIDNYFRYLPSGLFREIADYRKKKGGKVSNFECSFIEFLYTVSKEKIEINYLKLAEKLRIKQLQNKKIVRKTLGRCYETAKDLNYLLKYEIDKPGVRARKDVFYLNPARFYKLKKAPKKIENKQ